jgi:hypothetical protein
MLHLYCNNTIIKYKVGLLNSADIYDSDHHQRAQLGPGDRILLVSAELPMSKEF